MPPRKRKNKTNVDSSTSPIAPAASMPPPSRRSNTRASNTPDTSNRPDTALTLPIAPAASMSTSNNLSLNTAVPPTAVDTIDPIDPKKPQQWKRKDVVTYLKQNQEKYDLDDEDIDTVRKSKVSGPEFLSLTMEELTTKLKLPFGPAKRIEGLIKELKRPQDQSQPTESLKRSAEEDFGPITKRFKPNSTVYPTMRNYVYYSDQTEYNAPLINAIRERGYIRVYGPRASGKSSRILDAMAELKTLNYTCIYVDFQGSQATEQEFWQQLNHCCHHGRNLPIVINDRRSWFDAFSPDLWTRPVVLFFDEFDVFHAPKAADACSSILAAIRYMRNNKQVDGYTDQHMLHSIVAIGTFAITHLTQNNPALSPFNVTEGFSASSLTEAQVQGLFQEFANDRNIKIDSMVIGDIYQLTNGHAGMVNVCGNAIDRNLLPLENQTLDFTQWRYFVPQLFTKVSLYATFESMVTFVKQERMAVDFLRQRLLGHLDNFVLVGLTQMHLARSMAALGVLTPDGDGRRFKMSSPMIDSLIRREVIPAVFPSAPKGPPPVKPGTDTLDCLVMLRKATKLFSKDLIDGASIKSFKMAKGLVDGSRQRNVPRESVYDSELMRILSNWLPTQDSYMITGQWHTKADTTGKPRYCDIVIEKNKFKVVLELIASEDAAKMDGHINRAKEYKDILRATEAWVIHFTREDHYLDHPHWQSDDMVRENIHVVHVHHNRKFTNVRMRAKYGGSQCEVLVSEKERII